MDVDGSVLELDALIALRWELHRQPEVSGEEVKTARRVVAYLRRHAPPDTLIEGLGGHGVAAVYDGAEGGLTVMIRCELDALPIQESGGLDYRSENEGVAHLCGHDGHMAIVSGLGPILRERPPARGRVVLLFQPAEETGEGARRVLDDPGFRGIEPDRVFALHNLPGFDEGQVVLKSGTFSSASRGMVTRLQGAPSHASHPCHGRNPALAAAQIVQSLVALPSMHTELHEGAAVTPIHINVGAPAFGTSAADGTVGVTLRAHDDRVMERMAARAERTARALAEAHELAVDVSWVDVFEAVSNHEVCGEVVESVAREQGFETRHLSLPFPWSEDFGQFTAAYPGAMFGLGAGSAGPRLHNRDYDFPDALIGPGIRLFVGIIRRIVGG